MYISRILWYCHMYQGILSYEALQVAYNNVYSAKTTIHDIQADKSLKVQ